MFKVLVVSEEYNLTFVKRNQLREDNSKLIRKKGIKVRKRKNRKKREKRKRKNKKQEETHLKIC